jgi:hypothetical protein
MEDLLFPNIISELKNDIRELSWEEGKDELFLELLKHLTEPQKFSSPQVSESINFSLWKEYNGKLRSIREIETLEKIKTTFQKSSIQNN